MQATSKEHDNYLRGGWMQALEAFKVDFLMVEYNCYFSIIQDYAKRTEVPC